MKRIIALLLALGTLLCFTACNGNDPVEETTTEELVTEAPVEGENEKYKFLEYSDHIELTAYKGYDSYISLPSNINGKPVTKFGRIFKESLTLVTVIIPGTYTEIEDEAFYNAYKLQNLTIYSGSLTRIGANAFLGCQSLRIANIPDTVTEIHDDAFKYCTELIVYGKTGSAADEFAAKYSSIYFRDKNAGVTEASTEEASTEEASTEENSTAENGTTEVSATVENTTEESSTNE
ncbi:MAG: leucine-rich repeat domain-containing protein [Clostridia bacterium]|nr:leucine-rich repeat domain-containing protein [Clostridia bacterium]